MTTGQQEYRLGSDSVTKATTKVRSERYGAFSEAETDESVTGKPVPTNAESVLLDRSAREGRDVVGVAIRGRHRAIRLDNPGLVKRGL